MRVDNSVDLGVVQVHKKVIGDIAAESIKDIAGVRLAGFGLIGDLADAFGCKNFPGVTVTLDQDHQVNIKIRVIIDFGANIPEVARRVQDVIAQAVEDAVDIRVREINVNIHAVERRA